MIESDPYATLIEASEADVRLVMVDGIARAGRRELMGSFTGASDQRNVAGEEWLFDFGSHAPTKVGAELADLRLGDIEEQVREALGSLPSLAYQYGRSEPARSEAGASAEEADETEEAFDSGPGPDLRSTELYPMRLDPLTIADDPDYLPRLFDAVEHPARHRRADQGWRRADLRFLMSPARVPGEPLLALIQACAG